ncbi:hypothetical protein SKAU_G00373830 [Synaphobranchus kaupii]|uniref:Uncharacterized protein n=1 Tax=Synaphobranchus kaupii TaxID=118154 RepID=A0A9Q1IG30_SYNKA|nr:hypothetical protein SKAU_G00373830 [Synaphobranchus kaupii]
MHRPACSENMPFPSLAPLRVNPTLSGLSASACLPSPVSQSVNSARAPRHAPPRPQLFALLLRKRRCHPQYPALAKVKYLHDSGGAEVVESGRALTSGV